MLDKFRLFLEKSELAENEDKVAGAGLTVEFTELGNPIYADADLAIECKKLYGQQFDASLMPSRSIGTRTGRRIWSSAKGRKIVFAIALIISRLRILLQADLTGGEVVSLL